MRVWKCKNRLHPVALAIVLVALVSGCAAQPRGMGPGYFGQDRYGGGVLEGPTFFVRFEVIW